MGENAKSGHTQALTDGDYILSPSITNLFEGVHGNGILMYEDTATGDSNRNAKTTTPGLVTDNGTNSIIVRGGFAVLDGMVVPFGNINSGATTTITLQQSTIEGSTSALSSGESCLLVVYVCSNANTNYIQIEQGAAVSSGFPVTPESFLGDTSGLNSSLTLSSKQSTVLAVVKCQFNSGAGDLNLEVTEVFDMRTFIRPSPIYLSPMTSGSVGNQSNRMDSAADLDGMHGGGDEVGGFSASNFGALWQSYSFGTDGTDGDHVLYFSGKQGGSRRTHRLGPNKISVLNTAQTVRFDGPNIFNATPASGDINITPSGTFPPSHMIIVNNAQTSTHKVIFDPTGLSNGGATAGDVGPSSSAIFVYTGSAWVKIFASSTTTSTASGSAGAIQLSDGSAAFTNDTDLTFSGGNTLNTVNLTMTGLLSGPSGVSFKAGETSNPASSGPDARTLWYDDGNDVLKFNATAIQMSNVNAQFSLNDLSAGVINVAADSIAFIDADDSNNSKKESVADLATAMAGTGISASSGVLNLDATQAGITSIGPGDGSLTVAGDLIVAGTTTTVNSTTVTVDDVILTLGGDTAPGSDDNKDRGIEFRYHDGSSARVGFFGYDDSASNFVFLTAATNSSEVFSGTKGTIDANLTGGSVSATTITGSGDLNINSGKLFVDVSGPFVGINQATPLADLHLNKVGFGSPASNNTDNSSTSTALTIDLFNAREFRASKLLVSVENNTHSIFETAEMVVTHNGASNADATAAFLSTYGIVTSDTTQQGTYQVGLTGSGATQKVQLQVTPTDDGDDVTVRVTWQALEI